MRLRDASVLFLLSLALGLSSWLLLKQKPDDTPQFVGPPRSDYQLQNFSLQSFDEHGKLAFQLEGPRLIHDDQRRSYNVDRPEFLFYTGSGGAWKASSRRAEIDIKTRKVAMREQVHCTPVAGADSLPWVLTTEALDADPDRKTLSSELAVTLARPGSILHGIGLTAQLDSKQFDLAAAVRGTFKANHD